jgi:hypothetical protein
MGYPRGAIPLVDVEGCAQVFGVSLSAQIWRDFMTAALADSPGRRPRRLALWA